jgi:hypothetical protein
MIKNFKKGGGSKMKKSNVFISRVFIFIICMIFPVLLFSQVEDWVARYNGPGNLDDWSYKHVTDSSGNIFVLSRINNGTDDDVAVIKYNNDGIEQWIATYASASNDDEKILDFAVDLSGNVYVIGFTDDGTSWVYFIVKFNAAGAQAWVKFPDISLRAIEVDSAGFFYVAGNYWTVSNDDYLTAKYSSDGTQIWAQTYNGPGDSWDYVEAIALDSDGNVFVTGITRVGMGRDFGTVKYDNDGNYKWVAFYNSSGNQWDWADRIATDSSGNVYVNGTYNETADGSDAYATVKYDTEGNEVWARTYISGVEPYNSPLGLDVDESGNVCVTGYTYDGSNADFGTVKYDTDGNELWSATYSSPGDNWDVASEAVIAPDGSVYVTGYSIRTNSDITTIKYDTLGNEEWVAFYNGPDDGSDSARDVSLDPLGNVIVTGSSDGVGSGSDICTIKYIDDPAAPAIQKLEEAKGILANLDASVFQKENNRRNLIKRIDNVLKHIRNGEYNQALNTLNRQILPYMDGCALRGTPDTKLTVKGPIKKDWIIDCVAQQAVYPLIVEVVELLENLI